MERCDSARVRFLRTFEKGFHNGFARAVFRTLVAISVLLFPFGLYFVSSGVLPGQYRVMSTVSVALYGIIAFVSELRTSRPAAVLQRAGTLFLVVFVIEWLGVTTGIPFGQYTYTQNLPPLVAGVPPAIAVAWISVMFSSWRLARAAVPADAPVRFRLFAVALAAAVFAVAFDTVLEPMAAFIQKYWVWENGSVPVQNYTAWFAISFLAVFLLEKTAGASPETEAGMRATAFFVYGFQFVTFLVAGLVNGFVGNAAIAVALLGGVLLAAFLGRRPSSRNPIHRSSTGA
ncbi:MAG: carotenoid biosynthesis protein [Bacteroidota bacterium]|nr:carotenoid biosynthesis protein [Bacteroidota bacterium]